MRNNFNVTGNIGRIGELKTTEKSHVINFNIAESVDKDTTQWWSCLAFGKTAELISKYYQKGQQVSISGWLQKQEYEKDGVKKESYSILVRDFSFPVKSQASAETQQDNPQPTSSPMPTEEGDGLPF